MDLNLEKSESELLQSKEKKNNFLKNIIGNYILSANPHTSYALIVIICIYYVALALYTQSASVLWIYGIPSVITFFAGAAYVSARFSEGLEIAKSYLEETTKNITHASIIYNSENEITGIQAIDELYKIAEDSLSRPEEELLRVKEELSLVLNNIAAAVILYGDDGTVKFCSPYIHVLSGYSEKELQYAADGAKSEDEDFLKNIILEEDWQRYKRARLVSHLGEDSLVRFRIKHKSELVLWLESRMVPVINPHGDVESVMSITIDVTDSINYQKQIELQNQDLNDFAYMVSHDLKAPIFTIHGMADALKDDYASQLPQEAIDLLTFITDAAKRLDTLVASVLEYSALTNTNESQTEVSLIDTIQQVISDYKEQLKTVDAKFHIPEHIPLVKGDAIRFYQLFSNLIGNAIKYREPSRKLQVHIQYKTIPPNLIQIEIKDNGLGIPQNKIHDIFRPYRRAHGADIEGSGIGLACVKKIVERLGGQVSVISNEGEGSSFFIILPLSKPAGRTIPHEFEKLYTERSVGVGFNRDTE